ncbi:DUF4372 domain-containing protein [Chryseobacterium salivictor]|uniref:DUF4372 domain-containing protein n=1 Tax=Chryseobacterium salivictor TaxID=2547600 RepID=UPI001FEA6777|nr:DUF4372 domain-containing protein [Chryseobacterium salivictor]
MNKGEKRGSGLVSRGIFEFAQQNLSLSWQITLFSQIIERLDRSKFNKIVKYRETGQHNKGFNSWNHGGSIWLLS